MVASVERHFHTNSTHLLAFSGGSLFDMDPYSNGIKNLMKERPDLFEELLGYAEKQVRRLRAEYEGLKTKPKKDN